MFVYEAPNIHNEERKVRSLLTCPDESSDRNVLTNNMILDVAWLSIPQSPDPIPYSDLDRKGTFFRYRQRYWIAVSESSLYLCLKLREMAKERTIRFRVFDCHATSDLDSRPIRSYHARECLG